MSEARATGDDATGADPTGADPILPEVHARVRQAFLLGLARQPLAVPPALAPLVRGAGPEREPALALLALIGQRQRFVRPPSPPRDPLPAAARRLHEDARPVLPPAARRALARLAASVEKAYAPTVLTAAVRRIGEAGWRVHPFDLPELSRHIRADAESLGLAERAYLALTAPEGDDDAARGLFFERITAENWTTFPRSHRRNFIAELRREDAPAGRALVEGVWKTEAAPMRAALLEALAAGLGPDDKPFLEKLAGDRAPTVKQAAAQLLARMPASGDLEPRLAAAAGCFKRPAAGLGRLLAAVGGGAGAGLVFELPSEATKAQGAPGLRERLFGGMPIAALARAVGATAVEIIAALPIGEHQSVVLLLEAAIADGDSDAVQSIVGTRLGTVPGLHGALVADLAAKAKVALRPADATAFLASPAWRETLRHFREAATPAAMKDDGRLVLTATLMPREAMPAFVAAMAPLLPASARAARDYADLVLALPLGGPATGATGAGATGAGT